LTFNKKDLSTTLLRALFVFKFRIYSIHHIMFKNLIAVIVCSLLLSSCTDKPRVLVFSKTKGYRHESIDTAKIALMNMGKQNDFIVDTTEVAEDFNEANLKKYNAVVFLSTTGDVLNQAQQNEFMRFIQAGGGYVGIHAAADTEYEWWWYGKLVGAYFKSHPKQQNAVLKKVNEFKQAKEDKLPKEWKRWDEWYNYKKISPDINVLYNLDEGSYEGGENGNNHPITWYHDFDGGRAFYTGLGHTNESYSDPLFLSQVLMGLQYAMGDDALDYRKAKAQQVPEENRFSKVVLGYFFNEPTEMTILPDGRIIFIERKGRVKLYDSSKDSITVINTFHVWSREEDGMMGITKDPNFAQNNWLYIYYSHPERSSNILSRFEFKNGSIDMNSEKEMLEVPVQRQTCCHTGGSLAFGPGGNLFLSTGDNTSPFESDGYSPSDEREGRAPFDAQKSSANTNDLRGKILRIHPEPDGTYTIPEGNLFPKGEDKTRPEIYVMGNRNPYRISVDQKTGWLYWGEVGPDAGNDSDTRGPRGYDELNQAKAPGFFGWHYFVGINYAYAEYDFDKKTAGPRHDAAKPINNSPNNTGKLELPAVSPPFIYYPYAVSPDFPLMKTGGRNAMAGPIFYAENYKNATGRFPDYFEGKVIIYEWMRNWMRLLTLDKEGRIMDIEPFMDGTQFNNMIDMEFGPDGKLYILEYGTKWFGENMDARLVRIDYNKDNRAPIAKLKADKVSGAVPLAVNFSSKETNDPDGDKLSYELVIGDKIQTSATGDFQFTFDKPGVYRPKLNVSDAKGLKSSHEVAIIAGNEPPMVSIAVDGNSTYYFPNGSVSYQVVVTDKEDGSSADGKITTEKVFVAVNFLSQGYDSTEVASGHQRPSHPGKLLIGESDCKSCHMINAKSAGPSYTDIAKKYKGVTRAIEMLSDKVISGGSGVWGNTPMAAHPQISKENASTMVDYILSLASDMNKGLPLSGVAKFSTAPKEGVNFQSAYIISAFYDDNGFGLAPTLPGSAVYVLKAPVLTGGDASDLSPGLTFFDSPDGSKVITNIAHNTSVTFKNIDLTKVKTMNFSAVEVGSMTVGGQLEVYLDSKEGKKLGSFDFTTAPKIEVQSGVNMRPGRISFDEQAGKHNIVLVFVNPKAKADDKLYFFGRIILGN
jgi:cytochrome c